MHLQTQEANVSTTSLLPEAFVLVRNQTSNDQMLRVWNGPYRWPNPNTAAMGRDTSHQTMLLKAWFLKPGFEHFQGWDTLNLPEKSVPVSHQPHSQQFLSKLSNLKFSPFYLYPLLPVLHYSSWLSVPLWLPCRTLQTLEGWTFSSLGWTAPTSSVCFHTGSAPGLFINFVAIP